MRYLKFLYFALSIALLPINFAWGADISEYKNGLLTIPSVSTAEQVGMYQDVTFKLTEQGLWQLLNLRTIGVGMVTSGLGLTFLGRVDMIKTDSFPVQVFLRVDGVLDDCFDSSLGRINQRLENNRFDVAITYNSFVSRPPPPPGQGVACTAGLSSFFKTIPLPVYGLSAGIYSYSVNGKINGTFELTADNKLPGDY